MSNPRILCLASFLGLLALGAAACTTQVISGNGGGGGTATTGSQGQGGYVSTAPCTNCGGPSTIAITAAQMFGTGGTTGVTTDGTTGSGGPGPDPNTLYLELGNPAPTCAVPTPAQPCTGSYEVAIGIPTALQQVGTIDLSDPTLISTYGETASGGGQDCAGGGGSFVQGTLQITSIDAQQVTFTLSGTQAFDFGIANVDGTYTAQRCP